MRTKINPSILLVSVLFLLPALRVSAQDYPEITCPGTYMTSTEPGECYALVSESDLGTPTVIGGVPDVLVANDFNTQFPGGMVPYGTHYVVWTAIDEMGSEASCTQEIIVGGMTAVSELAVNPTEQPYGGSVSLYATVRVGLCGDSPMTGGFVHFMIGGQSVGTPIPLNQEPDGYSAQLNVPLKEIPGYPSNGMMSPGAKTVTAHFTMMDESIDISPASADLMVNPATAELTYTGPEMITLAAGDNSDVTIPLTVMLKAGYDCPDGDIRNATVTFRVIDQSSGSVFKEETVGVTDLLSSFDQTTGMVTWNLVAGTGGDDYRIFDIEMIAGGYFTGEQTATLTLYHTDGDFMAGGGHFTGAGSHGTWAAAPGTPVNFAFHIRYNRRGTNLIGKMHVNYDIPAGNGFQTLQIRASSVNTLGVDVSNPDASTGTFTAKASLVNLATGAELAGNLELQVRLTDRGEPGSSDAIGFTLWGKSNRGQPTEMLFSTSATGVVPDQYFLDGGNLVIHSDFSIKNDPPILGLKEETATGNPVTRLTVYPNPANVSFTVDYTLNRERDVTIDLLSSDGREARRIFQGHAPEGYTRMPVSTLDIRPGLYLVRLKTGLAVKTEWVVIGNQ
jgi:hypothetical protein